MGMIDIKEKVTKTLGDFLKRNREYAIEVYMRNLSTNTIIGRMYIADKCLFETDDKKVTLEWDNRHDIVLNNISIAYDEVLACYDEEDEYKNLKMAESVIVILKNGMKVEFECCGLRLG